MLPAAVTQAAGNGRTKSSSVAVPKVAFLGESFRSADMSMRSVRLASLLNSASNVDRNGLRDMGLLPELERCWLVGEWKAGEGCAGEAARLRNGLLEERLSESPGDGRLSVDKKWLSAPVSSQRQRTVKQATIGPYLALTVPRT